MDGGVVVGKGKRGLGRRDEALIALGDGVRRTGGEWEVIGGWYGTVDVFGWDVGVFGGHRACPRAALERSRHDTGLDKDHEVRFTGGCRVSWFTTDQ